MAQEAFGAYYTSNSTAPDHENGRGKLRNVSTTDVSVHISIPNVRGNWTRCHNGQLFDFGDIQLRKPRAYFHFGGGWHSQSSARKQTIVNVLHGWCSAASGCTNCVPSEWAL